MTNPILFFFAMFVASTNLMANEDNRDIRPLVSETAKQIRRLEWDFSSYPRSDSEWIALIEFLRVEQNETFLEFRSVKLHGLSVQALRAARGKMINIIHSIIPDAHLPRSDRVFLAKVLVEWSSVDKEWIEKEINLRLSVLGPTSERRLLELTLAAVTEVDIEANESETGFLRSCKEFLERGRRDLLPKKENPSD